MPKRFDEVKGRKWMAHIITATNISSNEIQNADMFLNEMIDQVLHDIYNDWSNINIMEGQTQNIFKSLSAAQGDWSYHASQFCKGDESHVHPQNMCVQCRKWYHED